jgi:hypothetical protein
MHLPISASRLLHVRKIAAVKSPLDRTSAAVEAHSARQSPNIRIGLNRLFVPVSVAHFVHGGGNQWTLQVPKLRRLLDIHSADEGFFKRTPTPPPFSGINSMPALSKVRRRSSTVCGFN